MRNKQNYIKLPHFLSSESGGLMVFFALALPVLLGFSMLAINTASSLNTRGRLSQAADEAALSISAIHNQNRSATDKINNEALAKRYMQYYIGNQGEIVDIKVKYDPLDSLYYVTSVYDSINIISSSDLGANDKTQVGNDYVSSGIAGKASLAPSADITFVLDFSSSMLCPLATFGIPCTAWSKSIGGYSRADALKKMVNAIVNAYQKDNNVQFAIVPFDLGVPFKPKDALNITHLPTTNEVGGEQIGCAVPYTLRSPYNQIDYAFWANKYLQMNYYTPVLISNDEVFFRRLFTEMDYFRYLYYAKIVGPALGLNTDKALVNSGICVDNGYNTSLFDGRYRYSCEANPSESIFTPTNTAKIRNQYHDLLNILSKSMDSTVSYNTLESARNISVHFMWSNDNLDYNTTLHNIFNPNGVIEFYQPIAPNMLDFRPFSELCQSAQSGKNSLIRHTDEYSYGFIAPNEFLKRASQLISTSKAQTYLIPLTKSIEDKTKLTNEFNAMTPAGGSDPMAGLLRSAHVAAEGQGLQKIIIVISDGYVDYPYSYMVKPTADIMMNNNVCDSIRAGLDNITKQQHSLASLKTPSQIHYVSLNPNQGYGEWYSSCANSDMKYVHEADDINDLISIVENIVSVDSETGFMGRK